MPRPIPDIRANRAGLSLAVLLTAVTFVFALAACGSSTGATAPDSGVPPTSTPVATKVPLESGVATASPVATTDATATEGIPSIAELTERALAHVRELAEGLPPRVSGTDGELAAAGYVADQLAGYGYEVGLQEFTARSRPRNGNHLTVVGPPPRPVRTNIFAGSGEGNVSGPLVFVGLARPEDLPSFSMEGMVALVERGVIPFSEKAANVFGAGADGMVVFNNTPGIFDGTLGADFVDRFDRPSVTISDINGNALVDELEQGPVNVRLRIETEERPSRNVVAVKPGPTADSPVVVIGGHIDAVPDTQGANDNASGTATFLVIAEELAESDLPFELRVVGFGSEELGLLGSAAYVAALDEVDRARITAMLNYDALGSGSLEIGGHFELSELGLDVADRLGIIATLGIEPANATSDHASFRDAGIRSMFFFGSDFSLIHSPDDTIEAMDPEMMGKAAAITLNGLLEGAAAP